jgi:hypothetical protein
LKKPRHSEAGKSNPGNRADDIPAGKRLLSYFMEVPLETVSSDIHPELHVSLQQGRLQLSTEKAIYSFSDLYTNFRRAFSSLVLDTRPVEEVLLLGLGLGSIPEMLEKKYGKRYHYTVVEIDEVVIQLAQRYTLSRLASTFDIYCADAIPFVTACPDRRYPFICVDIFLEDLIPESVTQPGFMAHLARILAEKGLLLFNCYSMGAEDRKQATRIFEELFLPVFPDATYLDTGTNWILVSDREWLR